VQRLRKFVWKDKVKYGFDDARWLHKSESWLQVATSYIKCFMEISVCIQTALLVIYLWFQKCGELDSSEGLGVCICLFCAHQVMMFSTVLKIQFKRVNNKDRLRFISCGSQLWFCCVYAPGFHVLLEWDMLAAFTEIPVAFTGILPSFLPSFFC